MPRKMVVQLPDGSYPMLTDETADGSLEEYLRGGSER